MNPNVLYFLAGIVLVSVLLLVTVFVTRKGPRPIDVEKYRTRWMVIEQGLKRDETSSYGMAVLSADKLLDQALQDSGCKGNTTGERMKTVTKKWSNPNAVWSAHKLRNQIAHETDFKVGYDDARHALGAFKQGLKELGAL